MNAILIELSGMAVAVWAAAEVIHRATGKRFSAALVALILGVASGPVAYWAGWLGLPEMPEWQSILIAMFCGLIAASAAGVAHDKIVKPVVEPKKVP